MRTIRCQAVLLALSAVVAGVIEPCGARAQTLTPEALTSFQWFNTLGFPEVKGCPLVRVADGGESDSGDGWPQKHYLTAFLLATNGDSFNVLTLDLGVQTFTNKPPGTLDLFRVGFDVLKLREEATARLNEMRNETTNDAIATMARDFGSQLSQKAQVFVLAWACWRQGLDDLAQEIYAEALKMPKWVPPTATSSTFQEDMEKEIGEAAFLACGFGVRRCVNHPSAIAGAV